MTKNPEFSLTPRAAFANLPITHTEGAGVIATDRDGLGIATVLARRNQQQSLAQRVQERLGIQLPQGTRRSSSGSVAFAATGPGAWLATSESGGNDFAKVLMDVVGDAASISDQSDGQAVLRLSGPRIRDALCKLVPIDLHPRVFNVDDVAVTIAAHMGCTLWRLEDESGGAAVFEIVVARSVAASFWSALSHSAAEFGFKITNP